MSSPLSQPLRSLAQRASRCCVEAGTRTSGAQAASLGPWEAGSLAGEEDLVLEAPFQPETSLQKEGDGARALAGQRRRSTLVRLAGGRGIIDQDEAAGGEGGKGSLGFGAMVLL